MNIARGNVCPSCGMKVSMSDITSKLLSQKQAGFVNGFLGNQYDKFGAGTCPNDRCKEKFVAGITSHTGAKTYIGVTFTVQDMNQELKYRKVKEGQTEPENVFELPAYIEQKSRGLAQRLKKATDK